MDLVILKNQTKLYGDQTNLEKKSLKIYKVLLLKYNDNQNYPSSLKNTKTQSTQKRTY